MNPQRVVILGASNKPDRYSNKAMKALLKAGHEVVLVNRGLTEIDGIPVHQNLADVTGDVDTLTLYVNPDVSSLVSEDILKLKPKRVIFNPRSENPELFAKLEAAEIPSMDACTLVLLRTGQF